MELFAVFSDVDGRVSPLTPLRTALQLCGGGDLSWQYIGTTTPPVHCSLTIDAFRRRIPSSSSSSDGPVFVEVYVLTSNSTLEPLPVFIASPSLSEPPVDADAAAAQYVVRGGLCRGRGEGCGVGERQVVVVVLWVVVLLFVGCGGLGLKVGKGPQWK